MLIFEFLYGAIHVEKEEMRTRTKNLFLKFCKKWNFEIFCFFSPNYTQYRVRNKKQCFESLFKILTNAVAKNSTFIYLSKYLYHNRLSHYKNILFDHKQQIS